MKRNENILTKVEFEVMSILWDLDCPSCAWDVLNSWPEPRPAYTTVATYLKVLYEKGYLDYSKTKGEGKTHMYVALVSRAEYTRRTMQDVKKNFFALPDGIDDMPGGFPYDFTMPTAIEKSELIQFHLVRTLMLMFNCIPARSRMSRTQASPGS